MQIVTFDEYGLAVAAQQLPPNMRAVDAGRPIYEDGRRMMLTQEGTDYVWDLRGQTCYGGEAGRAGTRVPDDPALIGKSWGDLAVMKSDLHPFGLLPEPRPETAAEKKAREKAEADAAVAAEKERIAKLVATSVQFAQACALAGIIDKDEAIAWASAGTLPAALASAIDAIPDEQARFAAKIKAAGAVQYERASPVVIGLGAALGKSQAELDALFKLAVTL